jgi:hypothetical protein
LSTKRSKAWNGSLDTLSTDYLKAVIEKMHAYGDRVQFEMAIRGAGPTYQVLNPRDRKMGFDSNHLLLRLNDDGNVAEQMSPVFSLTVVQAAAEGVTTRTAARSRAGTPREKVARAAPAAAVDSIEQQKYAYYKENRDALPDDISRHAAEISEKMRAGMSAEQAFDTVIKAHYQNGY